MEGQQTGRGQPSYAREIPDPTPEEERINRLLSLQRGQLREAPADVQNDRPQPQIAAAGDSLVTRAPSLDDRLSVALDRRWRDAVDGLAAHMEPGEVRELEFSGTVYGFTQTANGMQVTQDGRDVSMDMMRTLAASEAFLALLLQETRLQQQREEERKRQLKERGKRKYYGRRKHMRRIHDDKVRGAKEAINTVKTTKITDIRNRIEFAKKKTARQRAEQPTRPAPTPKKDENPGRG